MRFFFDRNMSPMLARMVDILERDNTSRSYYDDDRFTPTTPDIEWIQSIAADDPPWIVVSGDGRILKNKTELSALKEARLTFFCLSNQWMHMNFYKEQAWKFIKVWPSIVENAKGTSQRIFEISGGAGLKVERKQIYRWPAWQNAPVRCLCSALGHSVPATRRTPKSRVSPFLL